MSTKSTQNVLQVDLFREFLYVLQDLHTKANASLLGILETVVSEMDAMGFTLNSNEDGYVSHFRVDQKEYARRNIRYREAFNKADRARRGMANAREEIAACERAQADAKHRCVELAKKMAAEI